MKIFLRNPKISGFRVGFRSGYPKIFGFSGQVQVGLPEKIRVFGSGLGRVGSTRTRPETRFFSGSIVWSYLILVKLNEKLQFEKYSIQSILDYFRL